MSEQNSYDPKTLRKIQLVEVGMLREFIEICDTHNIGYFIAYGTAIGVLRHKGFIPWDDDIDICMTRNDFERFCEVAAREPYCNNYEMISGANSDDYLMPEAHWQFKGTKFVDKPSLSYKNPIGIFLDIFLLDNLADDPKARKRQVRECFLYGKLMMIRTIKHPIVPFGGAAGKIASAALVVMHYLMKILCVSKRWLYNKYTAASTRFNGQETKYVAPFRALAIEDLKLSHDEIYPLKDGEFEGLTVKLANTCEQQLESYYGDYMQIPPPEKQHNHRPEILDFGTALEYFNIKDSALD